MLSNDLRRRGRLTEPLFLEDDATIAPVMDDDPDGVVGPGQPRASATLRVSEAGPRIVRNVAGPKRPASTEGPGRAVQVAAGPRRFARLRFQTMCPWIRVPRRRLLAMRVTAEAMSTMALRLQGP